MDHGVDVVSRYRRFWFGNLAETDARSLLGGNALGGPMSNPEKWMSWGIDSSVLAVAPRLSLTGKAFADDWARGKRNRLNKDLAGGIATVLFNLPWSAKLLIKYGKAMHRDPKVWVAGTLAGALIPMVFNFYFMKKSGAWTYDN